MDLAINDIPETGLRLSQHSRDEVWIRNTVQQALHTPFLPDDAAQLDLMLQRVEDQIDMRGEIVLHLHATCDRCLHDFPHRQHIPLNLLLSPMQRDASGEDGDSLVVTADAFDQQYGFYEGRVLNLARLTLEQIVLAQPMQSLCQAECQGLCAHCGTNLNEGPCGCRTAHRPFAPRPLLAEDA
jgi:uncharacterized protein